MSRQRGSAASLLHNALQQAGKGQLQPALISLEEALNPWNRWRDEDSAIDRSTEEKRLLCQLRSVLTQGTLQPW